jgi:hypothetical protein
MVAMEQLVAEVSMEKPIHCSGKITGVEILKPPKSMQRKMKFFLESSGNLVVGVESMAPTRAN